MQKYLENKLFGVNLTGELSPNDYDSMHICYEFSVYSESEGFIAYETLWATQFTGYYQRDAVVTVDHKSITIRQIKEFFSEANANGSIGDAIQKCLNQRELQFSGYADLFIDELNAKKIGFGLEKNEIT